MKPLIPVNRALPGCRCYSKANGCDGDIIDQVQKSLPRRLTSRSRTSATRRITTCQCREVGNDLLEEE